MTKPETVLGPSADFSRLPYRNKQTAEEVNTDAAYISESIVAPPFRGKTLRLGKGIHLHWAMPDALTQGNSRKAKGDRQLMTFPALPDRWCVTRSDKAKGVVQKQWIVASDYLHPEFYFEHIPPQGSVTFPVPVASDSQHGQPFRYLGRSWQATPTTKDWPTDLAEGDYLNSFAAKLDKDPDIKQAMAPGLTAMGYGDPSFAAFYPNCFSVFGHHDEDIDTPEAFAKVTYDVVGWFDDPVTRDSLRNPANTPSPMDDAIQAQIARHAKERTSTGHSPTTPEQSDMWERALSHSLGWVVDKPQGPSPERMLCYGSISASDKIAIFASPTTIDLPSLNTISSLLFIRS